MNMVSKLLVFVLAVLAPALSFAETSNNNEEAASLPAVFTMEQLTPEQRKNVEENYVTTGTFKVNMESKDPVEMQPPSARELIDAAGKLFKKGYVEDALTKVQEAIDQDPDYLLAYQAKADILQQSGSIEDSIPIYDLIIEKNPNDAVAYMNRGYAYGRLNQPDRAIEDYNKSLELDPESVYTISARAGAYIRTGNLELAKGDYEKLVSFGDTEQGYYGLGNVAISNDNVEEALGYYNKTIAASPDFAPVYYMKGQILLQMERKQEAIESFNKAKSLGMALPPEIEQVLQ